MNLFRSGVFALRSGEMSSFKIDCDALTNEDITCLARMLANLLPPFGSVEGVPRGGLRLAEALQQHKSDAGPHLIVDDVLTTGGSMERLKASRSYPCCEAVSRQEAVKGDATTLTGGICPIHGDTFHKVIGAVLFARGPVAAWVTPLFTLSRKEGINA